LRQLDTIISNSITISEEGHVAKATIKSKSGAVITVEGSEKEVSGIIAMYERVAVVGHAKEVIAKTQIAKKEQKKRATASDLVVGLKEEGFFDKAKSLAEVSKALEEQGYIYPVTTLSGLMLGLVQKKLLGRKKVERKWVYGK
jgi:hypothetical protein